MPVASSGVMFGAVRHATQSAMRATYAPLFSSSASPDCGAADAVAGMRNNCGSNSGCNSAAIDAAALTKVRIRLLVDDFIACGKLLFCATIHRIPVGHGIFLTGINKRPIGRGMRTQSASRRLRCE
ncbi:hypothetical protein WJ32_30535 [Burkholderia ubonensis]|uniref:Uncharacterized protein n=1 Tax=Burkholderia ubonensis TaxID=101571 RepID=A0A103R9U2_9BURK|nr:hypothetical protein [Burkholderia ubonensis]AOJ66678.1 hypothetical protein WJ32_30535 [Burkholderia ubonensis]KVG63857.1 hypothetical protein WJ33_28025 [Burkholderia ubonensis]